MSSPAERELWVEVVGWDRFQHYGNRRPVWVKTYVDLVRRDDYLSLSGHRRAVLHGLWLEYASSGCQLRVDTASLSRRLSLRVTTADLGALITAGFITFTASQPLAARYQDARADVEVEVELPPSPPSGRSKASTTEHRCPRCDVTTSSASKLLEHMSNVHDELPCPIDGSCILVPSELYQHLRDRHNLGHEDAQRAISEHRRV